MKALTLFGLTAILAWQVTITGQGGAACAPVGEIRFVCGQSGPEDLVAVPGTPWLVASAFGPDGGLFVIDTKAMTSTPIYSPSIKERLDAKTYDSCPGPLQGTDREKFRTHGLYLKEGRGSLHTLYVVHHGNRESIEVFELDARPKLPLLTWIGCAVVPDPIGLNSVVALPGGGFVASNFDPRPAPGARGGGFTSALLEGRNNGELWEWHTGSGWKMVPGSETAGANGLEISKDGKWLYVAQWGNRSFVRLSRGQTPVARDQIPLGFRVDNVRWAADGSLLVAGQGGGDAPPPGRGAPPAAPPTSVIGRIDPKTMKYVEVVNYPASETVSAATVAVQVGDKLWVGSFRGDRIAIYPAKGLQPQR